jgi:hypothetical protein
MNWKAYDEVHFSDQYILRWVREGDEYVNRISKEMMEDLHAVVRQQQAEIKDLKQQVAFLEDWRDTWSPTIKQLMNINVKAQEK